MEDQKNKTPVFETFPLADAAKVDPETNVTIPSESDVKEVRDWTDFKEM